jgi:GTP pyrophosphokinase
MAEIWAEQALNETPPKNIDELCEFILSYYPKADTDLIRRAYEFSEKAHSGQIRRSGEPYISHPFSVACILAELRLDLATVATGLLHDTVEDTAVTLDQIEQNFGPVIRHLVDGVTKISKMSFRNTHEKQGENIRKMIVAMGKDLRVVLVKLCDRLHNMRTLNHMSYENQEKIATETLDIYAPLALRLGISQLKVELEDLSFRYSKPDAYYSLAQKVTKKKKERERYIDEVRESLAELLGSNQFKGAAIQGRPKHLYSIYRKMVQSGIDYEDIYDVLAFRIIVESVSECYEALGLVHSMWRPIPGRFKDFIAMPKANNYQSLHTTVIGPQGERIEVQIRTKEMHLVAERGVAAHWKYKESGEVSGDAEARFSWLRELVEWHKQLRNPDEFLETVKADLFEAEIYVFTPKGEVKELPDGATPIDFAFSVHTDVGHHCVAARVNGKIVPLKHKLTNGDTVEVMTSSNQNPSKDWLKMCVTNRAKSKIRAHVKNEQRKKALIFGQDVLEKEFRKVGRSASKILKGDELEKYMHRQGISTLEELYVQVGYGRILPKQIVDHFLPDAGKEGDDQEKGFLEKVFESAVSKSKSKSGSAIEVDGMSDLLVRFAKCCNPIPGDPITGFITRGRGVAIHRVDCEKAFEMDQLRRVDVQWASASRDKAQRVARIRIVSHDIPGLLKSMSDSFAGLGINVHNAQIRTTKDKKAVCIFDVAVTDTRQLSSIISDLQKIKGIIGVTRITRT